MLLTNIKRFIGKSTLLFIVFMITQIISVIALEYSFLNFRSQQIEYITYSSDVATFTVNFEESTTFSNISERLEIIKNILPVEIKQAYITVPDKRETRAYLSGQYQSVLYGDYIINDDDIVISHSDYTNEGIKIGDTVEVGEKDYNVIGVRLFEYCEIPLEAVKNSDKVEKLVIETKLIPSNREIQDITEVLQSRFSEYTVSTPSKRNLLSEYYLDGKMLTIFGLLALSMINISYIFNVVISKRKPYYAISMCCGSTFRKMGFSLIAESLLYAAFAIVTGTLIFRMGLEKVLFTDIRFSSMDYRLSVLCCFIIIAIPIVSSILHFSKKSIKELVYNR